jgi:glutathione peroxidase
MRNITFSMRPIALTNIWRPANATHYTLQMVRSDPSESNSVGPTARPTRHMLLLASLLLAVFTASALPKKTAPRGATSAAASEDAGKSAKPEKTAYDYVLPSADGKNIPVASFKGKYLLIVNLARQSSYNSQLPALIKLSETYRDRGLVVIGVPSNDFGASEPGSDQEIQKFYADAKASFLVTAVSKLTGDDALPLYLYLAHPAATAPAETVHWNYTKFFIDPGGKMIARLDPDVAPDSPEMLATVEQILAKRYKPADDAQKKPLDIASSSNN